MRRTLQAPAPAAFALLWSAFAGAAPLPSEVDSALRAAGLRPEALFVVVQEAGTAGAPLLAHQADTAVNPGSLFKLATTQAALEMLGPAWTWRTPVWLDGTLSADGVLDGSVLIQATGDPTLVLERAWLLLRQVRQRGVREIRGDIVLDRAAFEPRSGSPGDFDGEPLRPYNVQSDALLLNHKAVTLRFVPDPARGVARVSMEPVLAGVAVDAQVPLSGAPCGDEWRAALGATLHDPLHVRFAGTYPLSCGELRWPAAYADPDTYNARLVEALWRDVGGELRGRVRDGAAPAGMAPSFEWTSPPLAEVVRDINKFSNNVMAQQLFLTLALQWHGHGSRDGARALMRQWLAEHLGEHLTGVVVDNGSGLSRDTRITARQLATLLRHAWASPTMPELMASLPITGLDGTLRRSRATLGRAHLKTGSLRDMAGIAGIVHGTSGRRYVLVAMIQHPNANSARAVLDALVQWCLSDGRDSGGSAGR
jgi:D-alanyl-D-alanine carboxypeptidase/D-alanyl-D-alanine-endopeptidase (penicillin-binding protein 4)